MKNLLITGYRAHELGIYNNKHKGIPYIRKAIESRLVPLLEEGLEWVLTPGQYGVDLWACEAAISLKPQYPQLKCSIITAYAHPEEQWNDEKKEYYRQILKDVDFCAPVSKESYQGSWQFKARDELLLRKSDGILLVYDEDAGEASPRFMKERALKKHEEEGYGYMIIGPEEIQAVTDEDNGGPDYDTYM
ncbi:DUF1273 domain-containing protein [Paenibacillus sp. DMB20]|uniref:DUF1273 domain-containing protein n=1 Tax=Paenibacillus sp. DMB20 TaxID=1642570 RepID=UPI00062768AD|nr:DUF1273 domain-containing protein [Paenibacillus sp. DMB20]KKO54219.1 hypothetical protein XI25_09230 [Paenibacillus sp. DMB20]